jgi:hypothetical protein
MQSDPTLIAIRSARDHLVDYAHTLALQAIAAIEEHRNLHVARELLQRATNALAFVTENLV